LTIVPVPQGHCLKTRSNCKINFRNGFSLVNSLQNDTTHIEIVQRVTEISKF